MFRFSIAVSLLVFSVRSGTLYGSFSIFSFQECGALSSIGWMQNVKTKRQDSHPALFIL